MMGLISDAVSQAEVMLALCASVYDTRVEYNQLTYRESLAELEADVQEIIDILANLRSLSAQDAVITSNVQPTSINVSNSFKAPILMQELKVHSANRYLVLNERVNTYDLIPGSYPITGTVINSLLGAETSSRFSLSPDNATYSDIDITVDWTENTLSLGDTVVCLKLDNNRASRESGLLDVLSEMPIKYWSPASLVSSLGLHIDVIRMSAELNITSGQVSDTDIVSHQDLVIVGDNTYFVSHDLTLMSYISTEAASNLDGTYQAQVVRSTLSLPGDDILVLDIEQVAERGGMSMEVTEAKVGDVVLEGGVEIGFVSNAGNGATAELTREYQGGEVSVVADTYYRLTSALDNSPDIEIIEMPFSLSTYESAREASITLTSLLDDLSTLRSTLEDLRCPSDVARVWEEIRAQHIKVGLDRASDILGRGDITSYINLSANEGSYAEHLARLTEDLIVKVQS